MRLIDLDSDIKSLTKVLCDIGLCFLSAETVALKIRGNVRRCLQIISIKKQLSETRSTYLADSLDIAVQILDVVVKIVNVDTELCPLFSDAVLHVEICVQSKVERLHVLAHLSPLSLEHAMLLSRVCHDVGCLQDCLEHELHLLNHVV